MATVADPLHVAPRQIRWGRTVATALLLELVLFVVLIPIGLVFGMPGGPTVAASYTVFFTAVPLGCLVFGFLFGRWLGRRVPSDHAAHGALLGLFALAIYLGVCSIPPNSIATVIAGYGAPLFWTMNALRLVGCTSGAATARRA